MHAILGFFEHASPLQAAWWLFVENLALFLLTIGFGQLLVIGFKTRAVGPAPEAVGWREWALAGGCVVGNTVVTIVGWYLWRAGVIVVRRDTGVWAWLDVVVLVLVMDLGMYLSHRVAHLSWIYPIVHQTHHRYDRPRPMHLFVLNPLEVLGFGGLWLAVISVYSSSWLGMIVYLTLNLVFGMIGHLGVEPFPKAWVDRKTLRYLGTSTFHAGHHQNRHANFGFYTLIWDRLFGTLNPSYVNDFSRNASPHNHRENQPGRDENP